MKIILETERFILRELEAGDYEEFYELNSDPEVTRYVGDGAFASLHAARNFLENYDQYEKYGMGRWAVIFKNSGAFAGWCGLKFQPELSETGEVDLGYRFFRKYWGQKIASECAAACIEYGFKKLGLKRIVGRVMVGNTASSRVLEKCGFHYKKEVSFDEHPGLWYELENPLWTEKVYAPIDCNFYDELEAFATKGETVNIIYTNEIGVHLKTAGIIHNIFTREKSEYIELGHGNLIRLDKLISVNGKMLLPNGYC